MSMDRIVNLQYKICPNLFKYILINKKDIVLDRWKLVYIHVNQSEIAKLKGIDRLKDEVEKVFASPICAICGTRTTVGFIASYRGQECIGKTIDCPVCWGMNDKTYYKTMGLESKDKYDFMYKYISMFQ